MTKRKMKWLAIAALAIGIPAYAYANITSVGVTNGVPSSGTGTVSTLDALMADGGQASVGAKADTAWSGTGSGSVIAILKSIYAAATGSVPAGTNIIGKVGIDQTTPGTTNGVQVNAALPAGTNLIGKAGIDQTTNGTTNGVSVKPDFATAASVAINISTATTTQLVAISGSTKIYVTSFDVIAGGTGNITFEYGTGANCGTGTTVLTGAYNLTAQAGIAKGSGVGPVLVVPAGNALCALTSAAVQMSGSVSYQQY